MTFALGSTVESPKRVIEILIRKGFGGSFLCALLLSLKNQFLRPLSTEHGRTKCKSRSNPFTYYCPKQIQNNMVAKSKGEKSVKSNSSGRSFRSVGLTKKGPLPPLAPGAPGSGITSPRSSSTTREKRTPPPSSEESVTNASVKTTETDLSRRQKQLEHAILDVSDEFICPLSKELMVDPVLAEDGNLYERQDLERYIIFKAKGGFTLKSPVTGKVRERFDLR